MRPSSIAALLSSARAAAAEADRASSSAAPPPSAREGRAAGWEAVTGASTSVSAAAAPAGGRLPAGGGGGGGSDEVAVTFYSRRPATPSLSGRGASSSSSSAYGGSRPGTAGGSLALGSGGGDDGPTPTPTPTPTAAASLSGAAAAASAAGRGGRPPPFVGGRPGSGASTGGTAGGAGIVRPSSVMSAMSTDSIDTARAGSCTPGAHAVLDDAGGGGGGLRRASSGGGGDGGDAPLLSPSPPLLPPQAAVGGAGAPLRPPSGRRATALPPPDTVAEAVATLSATVDALRAAVAAVGTPSDVCAFPPPAAWSTAKAAAGPFVAAYDNALRLVARASAAAAAAPDPSASAIVVALEAGVGAAAAHHAAIAGALLPWLRHFAAAHTGDGAGGDGGAADDMLAACGLLFVACSHRGLCLPQRGGGGGGGAVAAAAALAAGARAGFVLTRDAGGGAPLRPPVAAALLSDVCAWLLSLRPEGRLPHLVTRGPGVVVVSPALALAELAAAAVDKGAGGKGGDGGDGAALLEAACYAFGILRNLAAVPAAAPSLAAQGGVSLAVDAAAAAGLYIAGAGGGAGERAAMQLAAQALHLLRAVAGDRVALAAMWRCNVVPTALALLASPRFLKYSEAVLLVARLLARLAPKVQAAEWLASPCAILLAGGPAAATAGSAAVAATAPSRLPLRVVLAAAATKRGHAAIVSRLAFVLATAVAAPDAAAPRAVLAGDLGAPGSRAPPRGAATLLALLALYGPAFIGVVARALPARGGLRTFEGVFDARAADPSPAAAGGRVPTLDASGTPAGELADTCAKLLRVAANLCMSPDVGAALAGAPTLALLAPLAEVACLAPAAPALAVPPDAAMELLLTCLSLACNTTFFADMGEVDAVCGGALRAVADALRRDSSGSARADAVHDTLRACVTDGGGLPATCPLLTALLATVLVASGAQWRAAGGDAADSGGGGVSGGGAGGADAWTLGQMPSPRAIIAECLRGISNLLRAPSVRLLLYVVLREGGSGEGEGGWGPEQFAALAAAMLAGRCTAAAAGAWPPPPPAAPGAAWDAAYSLLGVLLNLSSDAVWQSVWRTALPAAGDPATVLDAVIALLTASAAALTSGVGGGGGGGGGGLPPAPTAFATLCLQLLCNYAGDWRTADAGGDGGDGDDGGDGGGESAEGGGCFTVDQALALLQVASSLIEAASCVADDSGAGGGGDGASAAMAEAAEYLQGELRAMVDAGALLD